MQQSKPVPLSALSTEQREALARYENWLFARHCLAATSVALMSGHIRRLMPALGSAAPSHEDIDRVVGDLRRSGIRTANLVNTLNAVERYMEFLGNPLRLRRPKKQRNPEIHVLSEAKMGRLIAAAKTLRERAMLAVMAYSGCRNRELIALRVRDVDIAQQSVHIAQGKGGLRRTCCLSGDCMEVLIAYLHERKGEPDDLLFITHRHGHLLQTQDVRKIVRVIAKRAGLSGRVWPHLLRHSLATAMLQRGCSVFSIQLILGHSNVGTTMDYYLHPSMQNVRADYHRHVPSFI